MLKLSAVIALAAAACCCRAAASTNAAVAPHPQLLAAYEQSVCAVRSSGLVCWGQDDDGLLGFETDTHASDGSLWSSVTSTSSSSTSKTSGGGTTTHYNYFQTSDSDSTLNAFTCSRSPASSPDVAFPPAFGTALSVTMNGPRGSSAVKVCSTFSNGHAVCWGPRVNSLGVDSADSDHPNTGNDPSVYQAINFGSPVDAKQIAIGGEHACAIVSSASLEDQIRCWGDNSYGQLGLGHTRSVGEGGADTVASAPAVELWDTSPPVQVTAGAAFTCALLASGRAGCWGEEGYYSLGVVSTVGDIGDEAGETAGISPIVFRDANQLVTTMASRDFHSCAVTTAGELFCWGRARLHEMGTKDRAQQLPVQVDLGAHRSAVRVWTAKEGTCVLLDNDNVKCWSGAAFRLINRRCGPFFGGNRYKTKDAPLLPIPAGYSAANSAFQLVMFSRRNACVMYARDTVQCWGENRGCVLGVAGMPNGATVQYKYGDTNLVDGRFALEPLPSATPTPSASPSSTGTPSPSSSPSPTTTASPSSTGTVTATASPSTTNTPSPTTSGTPSLSPSSSASPSAASSSGAGLRTGAASSSAGATRFPFSAASIVGTVLVVAVVAAVAGLVVYSRRRATPRQQARHVKQGAAEESV